MKRGSYRIHPARVRLQLHGTSVSDIARDVGLSTSAVSLQLAGRTRLAESVHEAITERIGDEAAREVVDAIPSRNEQAAA